MAAVARASGIAVGKWIARSAANVDRSERPNLARSEHPVCIYMYLCYFMILYVSSGALPSPCVARVALVCMQFTCMCLVLVPPVERVGKSS